MEPYRVVVIDDDPDIAGYVTLVLQRRLGCIVTTVTDPDLVRDAVLGLKPDVVITDIEMPGVSGLDLIADIRIEQPGLPVIVMTGHASVDYAIKALRYRANEFLTKPVSSADLLGLVPRLAEEYRASQVPARMRQTVLAIGATPDDVASGVGGVLASHAAAGDEVTILTLSKGKGYGGVQIAFQEASAAASVIGARLIFEDEVEGAGPVGEAIERVVADVKPTIVYVHSRNDRRLDHRIAHEATIAATDDVNTVACYQGTTGTIEFAPIRFVPIDGFTNAKLAMLARFGSQGDRATHLAPDFILGSARYWSQFGLGTYCEPFEIVRESIVSLVMSAAAEPATTAPAGDAVGLEFGAGFGSAALPL